MTVETLLLIIAVTFVVIALFLVPVLLQIKATAQRVERLAEQTERELFPVVRELQETSENLKLISIEARQGVQGLSPLVESVEDVGQLLHRLTGSMRGNAGQYAGNALGLWLGLRAATKVFLKDVHKHKGGD